MVKNGARPNFGSRCQATRGSTTASNNNREERSERNCKETSLPCPLSHPLLPCVTSPVSTGHSLSANITGEVTFYRPRSTTPAISSKIKLFRRFLLRRTHLAFVCFLFLVVWSSTCRNLDHRQQRRHFLVDWPCHFVTFPHHFRGDLRNRLHPWYLLPLFVRPLMARPLSLRRALAESPPFRSTSFALAAQHIKLTKIPVICLGMNLLHWNEFYEEWNSV